MKFMDVGGMIALVIIGLIVFSIIMIVVDVNKKKYDITDVKSVIILEVTDLYKTEYDFSTSVGFVGDKYSTFTTSTPRKAYAGKRYKFKIILKNDEERIEEYHESNKKCKQLLEFKTISETIRNAKLDDSMKNSANNASGNSANNVSGNSANNVSGNSANNASGNSANNASGNSANNASGNSANNESGNSANNVSGNSANNANGSPLQNNAEKSAGSIGVFGNIESKKSTEESEMAENIEGTRLEQGTYYVGDDIPEGKYQIIDLYEDGWHAGISVFYENSKKTDEFFSGNCFVNLKRNYKLRISTSAVIIKKAKPIDIK